MLLFVAACRAFDLAASLTLACDIVADAIDYLGILELHQLKQLLAALEHYPFDLEWSVSKVAEYAPLVAHLTDADAAILRIGLVAPIVRIVLADELIDTIETHCLLTFYLYW
jgi:hypothetical protein